MYDTFIFSWSAYNCSSRCDKTRTGIIIKTYFFYGSYLKLIFKKKIQNGTVLQLNIEIRFNLLVFIDSASYNKYQLEDFNATVVQSLEKVQNSIF